MWELLILLICSVLLFRRHFHWYICICIYIYCPCIHVWHRYVEWNWNNEIYSLHDGFQWYVDSFCVMYYFCETELLLLMYIFENLIGDNCFILLVLFIFWFIVLSVMFWLILLRWVSVADVLLWKNWIGSLVLLVSSTVFWILFKIAGYNLLQFISNVLLLLVTILFFWAKSASILNRCVCKFHRLNVSRVTYMLLLVCIIRWAYYDVRVGYHFSVFFCNLM